jgi:hypothetical protein
MRDELTAGITGRQGALQKHLAAVEAVPYGTEEHDHALDQAMRAADALLAYEDEIPVRLDEPHQATSQRRVRRCAAGVGLNTLIALVLALTGAMGSDWWFVAVALMVAATGWLGLMTVRPAGEDHQGQFLAAAGCLIAATLISPAVWLTPNRWRVVAGLIFAVGMGFSLLATQPSPTESER